ncbi:MAG: hypothetical protein AB7U35_03560 [Sphingobium sp.]
MAGFRGNITITAIAGAALVAVAVPALGAGTSLLEMRGENPVLLGELGTISSFTPSIRDPKLSSAYARAALNRTTRSFRFTPTSGSMSGSREITILVRADSRGGDRAGPLGIQPLAFSLEGQRGLRKLAAPENAGRKPLDPVVSDLAGVRNFSLDRSGNSRLKANVQLDARRDVGTAAQTLAGEPQYTVDVGSSYSVTKNLNVTAGVRYAGPDNRLAPITDQRQDNQAVYVGTVFKF